MPPFGAVLRYERWSAEAVRDWMFCAWVHHRAWWDNSMARELAATQNRVILLRSLGRSRPWPVQRLLAVTTPRPGLKCPVLTEDARAADGRCDLPADFDRAECHHRRRWADCIVLELGDRQ